MVGDMTQNFSRSEFLCPCCGADHINLDLVTKLQQVRTMIARPVVITSGVRCAKHNAEVGGSPTSDHLTGHAVDIPVPEGWEAEAFARQCLKAGFLRAGYYNKRGFVHATIARREGLPRIWIGEK